jgi:hypothetical protein
MGSSSCNFISGALNQESRQVRDKQNGDIQQIFMTLQQLNQMQQSTNKVINLSFVRLNC